MYLHVYDRNVFFNLEKIMLFFYDSFVIDFYIHSDTVSHVIYFVGCFMTIIKYMFFLPQLLFLSVRVFL